MKHLSKICLIVWCLLLATSLHVMAASDGYNDSGQSSPSMGGSQGQTDKEQDSPSMGNTEGQNDSEEDSPSLQPKTLLGDVNGDDDVTIADATEIQCYLTELSSLDSIHIHAADVDSDGSVDITDATTLQLYLAGYSAPYPIGEVMIT